eukprot:4039014-Pyramimonas_sp.AAC.1
METGMAPFSFNDSLFSFIPKGTEEMDNATCTRLAAALRPISRKNTDSKIFAAAINEQMKTTVEQQAHIIQQGFIRGRNFCNNIMIMDTLGRIAGWRPSAGSEHPVQI